MKTLNSYRISANRLLSVCLSVLILMHTSFQSEAADNQTENKRSQSIKKSRGLIIARPGSDDANENDNTGSISFSTDIVTTTNMVLGNSYLSYDANGLLLFAGVQGISLYGQTDSLQQTSPYFGILNTWKLSKRSSVLIGTQVGTILGIPQSLITEFTTIDFKLNPVEWIDFHAGAYHANTNLSGNGSIVGAITGIEFDIQEFAELQLEFISGNNSVSGSSIVVQSVISKTFIPYAGILLFNQGHEILTAGMFGIKVQLN